MLRVKPNYTENSIKDKEPSISDPTSPYNPDDQTKKLITQVQTDMAIADRIRDNTYPEFNWSGLNESLITYTSEMQKRFNSTPPPPSGNPDDDWKSNHVQPMTRNKAIAVVASVTSALMKPHAQALNENKEEDVAASLAMDDCIEYTNIQSDYDDKILTSVIEMVSTPAAIVHQSYNKVMRKQKVIQPDGSFIEKETEDPILSGFTYTHVPVDELWISNIYEPDIQKQDFLVWRKIMTWDQAYMECQDKDNFALYVRPGQRIYFIDTNNTFFYQNDDYLENRLVYRDIYYNRRKDLQVTFYNGFLDGNPNVPYHRAQAPIPRADKRYPFAKSGYERFNSRFFYYMPLAAKLALVQDEMDVLHRAITDGTLLSIFPPLNAIGAEAEESAVIRPGALNSFSRPDSRVEPMNLGMNLQAGYQLLQDQKRTSDESSQAPRAAGLSEGGRQTLGEVELLQQNTQIQLGLIGRMIAKLVKDYGTLVVGSVLQHMTVGEIMDLTSELPKIKYNKYVVPNVERMGERKTSVIEFTSQSPKSLEEEDRMSLEILKAEKKKGQTIFQINPQIFRQNSFILTVEPRLEDRSASFTKRVFAFDRLKNSELIDQEANLKYNLIEPLYPGESTRFIKSKDAVQAEQMQLAAQATQPMKKFPGRPPSQPNVTPESIANITL